MADFGSVKRPSSSRSGSRQTSGGGGKNSRAASATASNRASSKPSGNLKTTQDLLSREEEYKRLNAELEAKTANLIEEAEKVMRDQESLLSKTTGLLSDDDDDDRQQESFQSGKIFETEPSPTPVIKNEFDRQLGSRAASGSGDYSSNNQRPFSQASGSRPTSKAKKTKSKSNVVDDVAVPENTDFSLANTISALENRLENDPRSQRHLQDTDDDILPQAAAGLPFEATVRFLKAKLRVMQEELDRLADECSKKDEENSSLTIKVKAIEDEKTHNQRLINSQQTQIERYKRIAEEAKRKSEGMEGQLTGLKKELDGLRRNHKQQSVSQNAIEVRLNRALEELEKYKVQLQRAKQSSKDSTDQDKKRIEQLQVENKRLEKQKGELMAGFKKQLKLIDILKRQKMHIEAAKMLSFTEEEFVKALEWGN